MRPPAPSHLLPLLFCLAWTSPLFARIGEPQEEFERRLLQPDTGRFMTRDRLVEPGREEEMRRRQPFNEIREYFPEDVRERKYWKSAVPNMLSNDNGWRVHVFYRFGSSTLEAYQRVGQPINEFEVRNILALNQGTSIWRQVDEESSRERSAIGCNYELEDGSLRARLEGNWLMVFSSTFDDAVKAKVHSLRSIREEEQAERRRREQQNAPGSTSGF